MTKVAFSKAYDGFIARLDREIQESRGQEEIFFEKTDSETSTTKPTQSSLLKTPPRPQPDKSVFIDTGATTFRSMSRQASKVKEEQPGLANTKIIYGLESIYGERNLTWDPDFACNLQLQREWILGGMWRDPDEANWWVQSATHSEGEDWSEIIGRHQMDQVAPESPQAPPGEIVTPPKEDTSGDKKPKAT